MLTKEQIEAIRKNPAWHSSVTDQLCDLALQALGAAGEPAWNQGMKCMNCGEPMPNPAVFAGAANPLSVMPALRCKCGSERFHGTFTTLSARPAPIFDAVNQSYWVIERFEDGRSAGYWDGGSSRSFTSDIYEAVQFRREKDAFWATKDWHWEDTQITEHIDLPDAKRPT